VTGDALRALRLGAGPRLTAGSGATSGAGGVNGTGSTNAAGGAGSTNDTSGTNAAGGAGGAGETTAAARRTAKAIRDFQAIFLMEMMKPLTEQLAGASSGDSAESGLGLSSGADVYSYFWGEALAQRLAGAMPGLPGMSELDGEKPGTPAGAVRHGLSRVTGAVGRAPAAGTSVTGASLEIGSPADPLAAGTPGEGVDPMAAGVMLDGLSALAALRAAGTASPDATATVTPAGAAAAGASSAPTLAGEVQALAAKAGRLFSLPENLVRAVVAVESGGRTNAVSGKGAVGLMQLMPDTAREMGVKDSRDAWDNLVGGAKYLARQLERFGRLDHALAAYNAGPGAVEKHGGVPPFPETRDYVRRVLAVKARLDRS
jgi:soluble lytic murein transglycosylase-like protein